MPLYHYGFSANIGAGTYDRRSDIATGNVNLIPNGGAGLPGPVPLNVPAAPVSGVFQFENNRTYLPDNDVIGIRDLTYQAANFRRPYVNQIVAGGTEWIFEADPKAVVPPGQPEPATNLRNLTPRRLGSVEHKAAAHPLLPVSGPVSCSPGRF